MMNSIRSLRSSMAAMLLLAGAGLASPAPHNTRVATTQTQPARRGRDPFAPLRLLPLTGNKSQTKRRSGRMTDADHAALAKAEAKRDRKAAKLMRDAARSAFNNHHWTGTRAITV